MITKLSKYEFDFNLFHFEINQEPNIKILIIILLILIRQIRFAKRFYFLIVRDLIF